MTNRKKIDIANPVRLKHFVEIACTNMEIVPASQLVATPRLEGVAQVPKRLLWDTNGKCITGDCYGLYDIENYDPAEEANTQAELERLRAENEEMYSEISYLEEQITDLECEIDELKEATK